MAPQPVTPPKRRAQLLAVAAQLMALRGFHGVSIADLGAAAGVSGPALYKHFDSKQAILGALLVDISERLLLGGQERVAAAAAPGDAVDALVRWHVEFALTEPDLIVVYDRDFASMAPGDQRLVRRLQREYVELWVHALQTISPNADEEFTRARVHATFGLLNSTPHSATRLRRSEAAEMLQTMGVLQLLAPPFCTACG